VSTDFATTSFGCSCRIHLLKAPSSLYTAAHDRTGTSFIVVSILLFFYHILSDHLPEVPYLTLPLGWTGSYTCPALRPYQLGPMRVPECNHKVTGSGYKAGDGCDAVNRRL